MRDIPPPGSGAARHDTGNADLQIRDQPPSHDAGLSSLDEIAAGHELINPLLAAVDRALRDERLDLCAAIGEPASQLTGHLAREERDALPLVGGPLTVADWTGVMTPNCH
jgi:hypothetical protein